MTKQYQEFLTAGTEVIAIVGDTQEAARTYFTDHNIPFPCLTDPEYRVYEGYEVKNKLISMGQRPALFIIDGEGIIRYAYLGWQQWQIPGNKAVLEVCRGVPC